MVGTRARTEPDRAVVRDTGPDGRLRARSLLRLFAPALVYLAVRGVGLLVLAWMAAENQVPFIDQLTSWDGQWYLGIARDGYDQVPAGLVDAFGSREPETVLAFFPGYPALVAGFAALPGISTVTATLGVSTAAGVVCAYGLVRLAVLTGIAARGTLPVPGTANVPLAATTSDRTGLVLVALFAAAPMSVVLSMAYSEALFCALAVWALVGVLERRWLLAGLCCAAAGVVRPTAAALVAAVGLAALVVAIGGRGWRPWAAALLAPAGLIGYLGYVAARTGQADGWFALQQQGWGSRFDWGVATLGFTHQALTKAPSVLEVGTVAVLAGAVVLLVVAWSRWWATPAWPLLVYAIAVLALDLGSNGLMNSKARLLLPAFVLLVPVAVGLARRRPSTTVAVLVATAVTSGWFGAYSLTVWPYAI